MSAYWNHRRVCVTGGSGFLAFHLVQQLRELGARVRVFGFAPRPDHPLHQWRDVESVVGDVLDRDAVQRAVGDCEVVFHTAGLVAVWGPALAKMHAVHVEGTRNVVASAPHATIVHTSSIVAVGAGRRGEVLDEDSPFNLDGLPIDYVQAKRNAEQVALDAAHAGQRVIVTNPGYLLGPDDLEPSVMGRFCARVWKGRVPIAPPGGFNLVDVRDVARGHLLAAERGQSGRRYILGGENWTMKEFILRLAKVAGHRPRVVPTLPNWLLGLFASLGEKRSTWTGKEPYPSYQQARLNRFQWFYRSDRAVHELGYEPRPLDETLADAHRWHGEHGLGALRGFNRWWLRPRSAA